jgi:hypothetical protein
MEDSSDLNFSLTNNSGTTTSYTVDSGGADPGTFLVTPPMKPHDSFTLTTDLTSRVSNDDNIGNMYHDNRTYMFIADFPISSAQGDTVEESEINNYFVWTMPDRNQMGTFSIRTRYVSGTSSENEMWLAPENMRSTYPQKIPYTVIEVQTPDLEMGSLTLKVSGIKTSNNTFTNDFHNLSGFPLSYAFPNQTGFGYSSVAGNIWTLSKPSITVTTTNNFGQTTTTQQNQYNQVDSEGNSLFSITAPVLSGDTGNTSSIPMVIGGASGLTPSNDWKPILTIFEDTNGWDTNTTGNVQLETFVGGGTVSFKVRNVANTADEFINLIPGQSINDPRYVSSTLDNNGTLVTNISYSAYGSSLLN